MTKKVIIIGASGHGKVLADIVLKSGDKLLGFLDDNETLKEVMGFPVLGNIENCIGYDDTYFIIGIGNNLIRKKIADKYKGLKYYTAIHPNSVVADNVTIGEGTCVMAGAIINTSSNIGKHCIINTSSVVEHDDCIEDYVHISPGAVLCGTVNVGECTHIGAGAVVKNNINICNNCVIGVGAALVRNIEHSGTYVGVPAKEINN